MNFRISAHQRLNSVPNFQCLTLDDLYAGSLDDPIWVINGSEVSIGQLGEIWVTIPKLDSHRKDALFLRQTWLAQNVTDQVRREQLLASEDFRSSVDKGLILLVTSDYAQDLNSSDAALKEMDRLNAIPAFIRAARAEYEANNKG